MTDLVGWDFHSYESWKADLRGKMSIVEEEGGDKGNEIPNSDARLK